MTKVRAPGEARNSSNKGLMPKHRHKRGGGKDSRIPPVPHQIHNNSKHPLQNNPRPLHPPISILRQLLAKRPTRLRISPDLIPFSSQTQRQEFRTHIRRNARQDDLTFVSSAHRISEFGIVPGVDFAVATDQGGGGVEGGDFFGEGAVGAGLGGGGEDDGDGEEGCYGGVGDHVVAEDGGVVVAYLVGDGVLEVLRERG